jgi:hypothetical protein
MTMLPSEDTWEYALVRRIAQKIFHTVNKQRSWQSFPTLPQQRVQDRYENLAREVIREVREQAR